jgi:hypothetical protein
MHLEHIFYLVKYGLTVAHNLSRASLSQSSPIVHYYYPRDYIFSIINDEIQ